MSYIRIIKQLYHNQYNLVNRSGEVYYLKKLILFIHVHTFFRKI